MMSFAIRSAVSRSSTLRAAPAGEDGTFVAVGDGGARGGAMARRRCEDVDRGGCGFGPFAVRTTTRSDSSLRPT
jgi:hypothetical protein